MIDKRFEMIDKSYVDALIANEVREGKILEYKEILPGNSDGERKEFLNDISSFANASGGHLIYGIREKRDENGKATGIPESVIGIGNINSDTEIRRLENRIRDGIDPRIHNIQMKIIEGFPNGSVLIIHVPQSWSLPHMVTFQNSSRFYSRNSAGKYPLDVGEIRAAFALSETLPEKIRHFRDERIAKIVANETPVPLAPIVYFQQSGIHTTSAKVVMHVLPIKSLEPGISIDLSVADNLQMKLQPIEEVQCNKRFNFDGLLTYECTERFAPNYTEYVQVFRNGCIEAVSAWLLSIWQGSKIISPKDYEGKLIKALERYLSVLKELQVVPPIFIMLSILDVKDYFIGIGEDMLGMRRSPSKIDRNTLILPDIIVEDFETDPASILRPTFDTICQSAGWKGSANYDAAGKWKGK